MYKLLSILLFTYGLTLTTEDIYDNSYALIIGIDKYQNVQNLNYAVKDAESIHDILVNTFDFPEFNIKLLKNEEATKQNILKSFSDITKKADYKDRVLIYFAGHGATDDLPEGGEMGYLLPVDGDNDDLFLSSIAMDDLKRISLMSKAKHLLYLVDACYGGIAAIGSRGLDSKSTPNFIEKITKNKSRQIITAGGRGEEVIEKSEWGHSAFTLNLIRGLKEGNADLNADSYITANELGMFLREKVTIDSENQQTPQYGRMTSQEGEFVFVYGSDDNKQTISLSSSANFIQTSRGLEIQIPEAFNIGTVKMNQYSAKILNDIAEYLKENPYKIVLIECHTDSYPVPGFGSFVYPDNWKLSVARANEISDYLLFQGIQPEKMMALGFADRWPFGNSWEDVYSGEITDSIIDSMNVTVNQRTKNRRINIVITNTEKEYGEANKTIYYEQKLLREYEGYKFVVSNTPKNISYKLIISKFDGNYTISSTFPPIVGPNTGQLLASIPHFIMQAPNESSELEKWEHSINDLEKRLSNWEVIAPMGDSLTTYWGKLGEYYFTFYVQ